MNRELFEYLKKYRNQGKGHYNINSENCFWSLDNITEIIEAEKRIGFAFPASLKKFWLEIGYGNLTTPHNAPKGYESGPNNEFLRPNQIADIILLKEESELILPWVMDYYEEGYLTDEDIPFFEVITSDFLIMKPKSNKPNAVYNMIGEVIEDEFEKFIYRLYYESPTYYLHLDEKEK